jgi:hypothetical protein
VIHVISLKGNGREWLIAAKSSFDGTFEGTPRAVRRSSLNSAAHKVRWLNRGILLLHYRVLFVLTLILSV